MLNLVALAPLYAVAWAAVIVSSLSRAPNKLNLHDYSVYLAKYSSPLYSDPRQKKSKSLKQINSLRVFLAVGWLCTLSIPEYDLNNQVSTPRCSKCVPCSLSTVTRLPVIVRSAKRLAAEPSLHTADLEGWYPSLMSWRCIFGRRTSLPPSLSLHTKQITRKSRHVPPRQRLALAEHCCNPPTPTTESRSRQSFCMPYKAKNINLQNQI